MNSENIEKSLSIEESDQPRQFQVVSKNFIRNVKLYIAKIWKVLKMLFKVKKMKMIERSRSKFGKH